MKIRLNVPLRGYPKDKIINFDYIFFDKYWLKRLKDSEYDNCVSIVEEPSISEEKVKTMNKKTRSKNGD